MLKGTPPYFSTIFILFFINTHEYAKKNLYISTLNKKTMSGLQFGTRVGSLG